MKAKLTETWARYGAIALATYLCIFGVVFGGFVVAIRAGWRSDSAGSTLGTLGAAYLATQLAKPLRILATVGLTPLVARIIRPTPTPSGVEPSK